MLIEVKVNRQRGVACLGGAAQLSELSVEPSTSLAAMDPTFAGSPRSQQILFSPISPSSTSSSSLRSLCVAWCCCTPLTGFAGPLALARFSRLGRSEGEGRDCKLAGLAVEARLL